jgi:hypothetical protein
MNTEETNNETVETAANKPVSQEDGVIKVDLRNLNNTQDAVQEQSANEDALSDEEHETELSGVSEGGEEQQESSEESSAEEFQALEEVQDAEEEEAAVIDALSDEAEEAVVEAAQSGNNLPENIQKLIDFMDETGGSLADYVRLNTDYSKLDEDTLLIEYYQTTRPDLDEDEIAFLIEDKFMFDEDEDDYKEVKRKKLARKEELLKAKKHLEGLKTRYYDEIKSGSKLTADQQKAIEFFNRYNKENEESQKVAEKQVKTFLNKTKEVFSTDFKGFEYSVGDKKYRLNIKNPDEVMTKQSDLNNFVKKFLNENNEIADAKGYHKSLFTAMNTDLVANHFYEQGKADAIKESMAKAKNIDMSPRGAHENVTVSNGWTIKAVDGVDNSRLRVKFKK